MRYTPRSTSRTRRAALAAVATMTATALVAGCSSSDDGGGSNGGGDQDQITLTIGTFGQFGYEEAGLYDEYMELNDHIKIEQTLVSSNDDYYAALVTRLPTGSGLLDIQAVEVGNIYEITHDLGNYFVDFNDHEDVDFSHWLDWKVAQATDADGKVVGLGTDIGPMGICYRSDYFEDAGLPTDRDEVSALWAGDWDAYIEAGEQFKAATSEDATWVDASSGLFNAVVNSFEERYYSADGELIYEDSEAVSTAWDVAMKAVESDLTNKLPQFEPPWDQALANGDFATISCPAWMLGNIQEKSGETGKGHWDFAQAPQPANWGGSFLAVPEASRQQEEAVKLAAWLTAPEQQVKIFEYQGTYPSSAVAGADPGVASTTNDYFGDAPIGELFATAAENIPSQIVGPRDQTIQEALSNGLVRAEQQGESRDEAWDNSVRAITNALDD